MSIAPGPWRACGANDGRCSCGLIYSIPADAAVGRVLQETEDGRWSDEAYAAHIRLFAKARAMYELLREVSPFAPPSPEWRRKRAALLNEIDGITAPPPSPG